MRLCRMCDVMGVIPYSEGIAYHDIELDTGMGDMIVTAANGTGKTSMVVTPNMLLFNKSWAPKGRDSMLTLAKEGELKTPTVFIAHYLLDQHDARNLDASQKFLMLGCAISHKPAGSRGNESLRGRWFLMAHGSDLLDVPADQRYKGLGLHFMDEVAGKGLIPRSFEQIEESIKLVERSHRYDFAQYSAADERSYLADIENRAGISISGYRFLAGKMASQEEAEKLLRESNTDTRMLNDFIFPLVSFTAYPDEKKNELLEGVVSYVGDRMRQSDDHEFIDRAEKLLPELKELHSDAERLDGLFRDSEDSKRAAAGLYKGVEAYRISSEASIEALEVDKEALTARRADIDRRELAFKIYEKLDVLAEREAAYSAADSAAAESERRLVTAEVARLKETYAIDRDAAQKASGEYKGACEALDGRLQGDMARRMDEAAASLLVSGRAAAASLEETKRGHTDRRSELSARKSDVERELAGLKVDIDACGKCHRDAVEKADRMAGAIDAKLRDLDLSNVANADGSGYAAGILHERLTEAEEAEKTAREELESANVALAQGLAHVEDTEKRHSLATKDANRLAGDVRAAKDRADRLERAVASAKGRLAGAVPMTVSDAELALDLYSGQVEDSRSEAADLKNEKAETERMLSDIRKGTVHASLRQADWFEAMSVDVAWGETELLKMDPETRRDVIERSHGAAAFSAIVSDADLEAINSDVDAAGRGPGSPVIALASSRLSDLGSIDLGSDVLAVPNYEYLYDPEGYRASLETECTRIDGRITECEEAVKQAERARDVCKYLLNVYADDGEPEKAEKELERAREECAAADGVVAGLREELSAAKASIEPLRRLVTEAEGSCRAITVRLGALRDLSDNLIPTYDRLHGAVAELSQKLEELERSYSTRETELQGIERSLSEAAAAIKMLEVQLTEINSKLDGLKVSDADVADLDIEVVPFEEAREVYDRAREAADKDAEELKRRCEDALARYRKSENIRNSSETELLNIMGATSLDEVPGIPELGDRDALDKAFDEEKKANAAAGAARAARVAADDSRELARREVNGIKEEFQKKWPDMPRPERDALGSGFDEERSFVDGRIAELDASLKDAHGIISRLRDVLDDMGNLKHLFMEYLDSTRAVEVESVEALADRVSEAMDSLTSLTGRFTRASNHFSRRCKNVYDEVDRNMVRIKAVFSDYENADYSRYSAEGAAHHVAEQIDRLESSIVVHKSMVRLVEGEGERLAGQLHDVSIDLIASVRGLKSSTGKAVRIKELEGVSLYGSGDETEALEFHNRVTGYFKRRLIEVAKEAYDPATNYVDKKVVEKALQPNALVEVWMAAMGKGDEKLTVQFRSAREGQSDKWLGIKAAAKQSGGESGSSYLVLLAGLVSLLRKGDKDVTIPLILDNSFHGVSNSEFYDRIFSLFDKNGIQLIMVADQPDIRLRDKFDTQIVLKKGSDVSGNKLVQVAKEDYNEEIRIATLQKLGIAYQESFGF